MLHVLHCHIVVSFIFIYIVLSFQVLNDSNISQAGLPEGGLEFLCPNVVDLDLSTNRIKSWYEVTTLFGQLPHLKYVNLARNPLRCDQVEGTSLCLDSCTVWEFYI